MMLTAKNLRDVESVDSRVLGAIRLVDQATGVPLIVPATIVPQAATIVEPAPPGPPTVIQELPLGPGAIHVRQNRRGWFVVFRAPLFDTYTQAFLAPAAPPELSGTQKPRLRFAITDAGPHHLPRTFELLLPRALNPDEPENVFTPLTIALLRAPAATRAEGWAALRVRVVSNATGSTLPGVLLRVFRRPRPANAVPLGIGLTEWRDEHTRGEALVPLPGLLRFAPGSGANVLETTHAIEIEATRDQTFPDPNDGTPPVDQIPDVDHLLAGIGATVVRRVSPPGAPAFAMTPPGPLTIAAGHELALDLTMP